MSASFSNTSSYDLSDSLTNNSAWSRKIEYNSSGLVTDGYDARGVHTQFSYDDLNRVQTITYSDSTPTAHYYYDSQSLPSGAPSSSAPDSYSPGFSTGRLVAMTYGSGATGNYFGYDLMGRVTTQFQLTGSTPAKYKLSYGYNLAGMLTSETYPNGRALSCAYDEGGRLASVSDGTTTFANSFTYVAHGGLKSETWGNGAVHSLNYNRRLQTSEVKLKQSATGSELQRYNYSYGQVTQTTGSIDTSRNNGQIGRIDGFINGAATKEWDQRFVYDELGRLKIAAEYQQGNNSSLTWSQQYTYDRHGNRFQSGSGNSGVTYTPVLTTDIDPATNRFISSGSTPVVYDNNNAGVGNITSDAKFRGLSYAYDANNRQTSATNGTWSETQVYDCVGQRVQTTANGVTRQMVYDVFGQQVADYSGASLQRENIYRGGQLLSVVETPTATAPSALSATPSNGGSSITLSWTAASGATNYRVERKGAGSSYVLAGTTASTGLTDNGVTTGNAYLYKVCAADGQNNCTSNYTNVALGAAVSFTDDPLTIGVTAVKAQHVNELRQTVNAVRSLAGLSAATWTNPTLTAGVTVISADDVRDLRSKLDEALIALAIQTSSYTDSPLAGAPNGTLIKKTHITELRERTTSGSGGSGSGGSSGGVQYILSDAQGSSRAVMNNNGVGTSTISARHDYLPFGQEIGSGTGSRTGTQGYGASDTNRQKYGLTERDDTTGLDHTWWRKYENTAGRWISPDPYNGSMTVANPQSFNRYSYVGNDPVNSIDPSGLLTVCFYSIKHVRVGDWGGHDELVFEGCIDFGGGGWGPEPSGGGDGGGGGGVEFNHPQKEKTTDRKLEDCVLRALGRYLKADTVTYLKQGAVQAGIGLGVGFALFFGAESTAGAIATESFAEIGLGLFGKIDHFARAGAWAAVAVATAAVFWTKLVKESFHNKTEALAAVKECYAKL